MRTIAALSAALVVVFWSASPQAWGMDVHRLVTARALDGLPPPLKGFFAPRRAFVIEHSVDPDLWRVVGLRTELGNEDPNHFLDIDDLDEPAPFTGVPREWSAFLARYGEARATRAGRLPWRTADIYDRLVTAFKATGAGTSPYAADNARYLSAVIAHYVGDAFVPFHAVANYDGQLTNQRGVHARFETELVRRYWSKLAHPPVAVTPVANVRTFIFDTLIEGVRLTPAVLDADRKAAAGQTVYDDAYYARFYAGARPILEVRLAGAASGIASVIHAAWIDAGKPDVTTRPPQRR